MKQFGGPLVLGALLAFPAASLSMSLTTWAYVVGICGLFALILAGLVVQIRAGLRARSVLATTLAYWSAASLVMAVLGQAYDLVPLLVSAGVSALAVITVTTAARALGLPLGAPRSP